MKTIQSQVSKYLRNNTDAKLKDVEQRFPNINTSSLKSCYYRTKNVATKDETVATHNDRITMDMVEKLIISGKTPIPLLRVMTDFLKVKSQDHSELEEIDMELFYKKAMEE